MSADERDLVFVGDVHLDREDAELPAFLAFLDRLGQSAGRVVFLGDLFNLWIGSPEMEERHHRAVLDRLSKLREGGVVVRYVEGNRDFRIGPRHAGQALDDAGNEALERFAGQSLLAVHGDLANRADLRYRAWRLFSRSLVAWGLFRLLSRSARLALAYSLERHLRGSNAGFKGTFPDTVVRAYARALLARGHDVIVLGHFHVERELEIGLGESRRRVFVLPEWKGSHRHLRVSPGGAIAFVPSLD